MTQHDEFLEVFRYLQKKKRPIKMLSVFKGIPVTSNGTVLYADGSSLVVRTDSNQIVCLYANNMVHLQNDIFPRPLRADLVEMDVLKKEVALSGFAYVSESIGLRQHVRVEPRRSILGILQTIDMDSIVDGSLLDISRHGIALSMRDIDFPAIFFETDTYVNAFIRLPDVEMPASRAPSVRLPPRYEPSVRSDVNPRYASLEQNLYRTDVSGGIASRRGYSRRPKVKLPEFRLVGKIVNVKTELARGRHRIGIKLSLRDSSNDLMVKFISQRQAEIIREMRAIYDMLTQRKTVAG